MRRRDVPSTEAVEPIAPSFDVVKELDAFPKIPENYKETTATGGGISLLVFAIIFVLIVSEVRYYTSTEMIYSYAVDTEFGGQLKINVDLTVAMKCAHVGADVLDLTGQGAATFGRLEEEDVHYELSPHQRRYFEMVHEMNAYVRSEYHALHDFLWRSGLSSMAGNMPKREVTPEGPTDGCRLHGSLTVNKVAGNFHITAGKSIKHPAGHAHLAGQVASTDYNFTHRIEHMSFGDNTPGIINPLDGDEKVTDKNYHMFQYFIQVVPTEVSTAWSTLHTYQFSVTEKNRSISHAEGSHGVPGIFVKYDLSPLRVAVKEQHKPYWQFLARLAGIVGGIFATTGVLNILVSLASDVVCCRFKIGKYQPMLPTSKAPKSSATSLTSSTSSSSSSSNSQSMLASPTLAGHAGEGGGGGDGLTSHSVFLQPQS